jgi:hypothetical protein
MDLGPFAVAAPAARLRNAASRGAARNARPAGHSRYSDSQNGGLWRKADPHVRRQRPLSVLALALTQGVLLCLVQSLRDVGDQIDGSILPNRGKRAAPTT